MTQVMQTPKQVWKAEEDVMATMRMLIASHHPHLAVCDDQIAVLFTEKAASAGDCVVSGKVAKASPLIGLLGDKEYKFVITLIAEIWQNLTDNQRVALLDHHLCACRTKEAEGGDIKYHIQKPELNLYKDNLERYGFWWNQSNGVAPLAQNVVASMFG